MDSKLPLAASVVRAQMSWSDLIEEGSRISYHCAHLAWLSPWVLGLLRANQPGSPILAFALLLGITWGADLLSRQLALLHIKKKVRWLVLSLYVAIALGLILSAWAWFGPQVEGSNLPGSLWDAAQALSLFSTVIPGEFVLAVFVLLNIFHGVRQANEFIGPPTLLDEMLWGTLGFVLYGVVISRVTTDNPVLWFFLFIAAMVVGLFLYRLADFMRRSRPGQRGASPRWRAGLLAGVLLFLGISGFLSGAVGAYLSQIRTLVGVIVNDLLFICSLPFLGILAVFEAIFRPYLGSLSLPKAPLFDLKIKLPEIPGAKGPGVLDQIFMMIDATFKPFILWAILIAVTLVILRVALFSKQSQKGKADYFETILELDHMPVLLGQRLRNQVAALVQRLREIAPARRRKLTALRIRQVYAAWLAVCADRGVARQEAQTPAEHAEIAAQEFPNLRSEIFLLVSAYHKVRYGEFPEHPEELAAVEQAWKRLRTA